MRNPGNKLMRWLLLEWSGASHGALAADPPPPTPREVPRPAGPFSFSARRSRLRNLRRSL